MFWLLAQAILPGGGTKNILGPEQYTIPAGFTTQFHIFHNVPLEAPLGIYEYWSRIGILPSTLYDEDRFMFKVSSSIIKVPDDYPTIQQGINAAVDGDTVLVADGTYTGDGNRDIDFRGKAIVVMSENGPEVTIIDCDGDSLNQHRGFYFHNWADSSSVVQGFTIRNGYHGGWGGAILCDHSSPKIIGNIILDNTAIAWGAGIMSYFSSSIISNNIIRENQGGGIYSHGEPSAKISNNIIEYNTAGRGIICYSSSAIIIENVVKGNTIGGITCWGYPGPTIINNTIIENSVSSGGGIMCWGSSNPLIGGNKIMMNTANLGGGIHCMCSPPFTTIINNVIADNIASDEGGGIYCTTQSATISDNIIIGNTAEKGGGIRCNESSPVISGNFVRGNSAAIVGGGISLYRSSSMVINNTITGNYAHRGGGVRCDRSSAEIYGNTIAENSAAGIGAGIYIETGAYSIDPLTMVSNCILWGNHPTQIYGPGVVSYSDIEGGWEGEGNIDADPMIVLQEKGDYRLLWHSPCIDTGHPDSLDADRTRSDMGAHYFNQLDYLTLYVTPDTTEVAAGGQLGVTYTVINRWEQSENFWFISKALIPSGRAFSVLGPNHYTIPANHTFQGHLIHDVPEVTPARGYEYMSAIGLPPSTLYDWDSFKFYVVD